MFDRFFKQAIPSKIWNSWEGLQRVNKSLINSLK